MQVEQRAAVQAALKEQGIPTAVHYPTLLCQQLALRCKHSSAVLVAIHLSLSLPASGNEPTHASLARRDRPRSGCKCFSGCYSANIDFFCGMTDLSPDLKCHAELLEKLRSRQAQ